MPAERLYDCRCAGSEVLRLRHLGLTERVIARMIGMSNGVVHGYLRRARDAGMAWPLPEVMDDEGLSSSCSQRRLQHRKTTGERSLIGFMWRRNCAAAA